MTRHRVLSCKKAIASFALLLCILPILISCFSGPVCRVAGFSRMRLVVMAL